MEFLFKMAACRVKLGLICDWGTWKNIESYQFPFIVQVYEF